MLPQGSGLGALRVSLYAMAPQLGHVAPLAGFSAASSDLMRNSSASSSFGAAWMRFQFGIRSSVFITSSSIPMISLFEKIWSDWAVAGESIAPVASESVAQGVA